MKREDAIRGSVGRELLGCTVGNAPSLHGNIDISYYDAQAARTQPSASEILLALGWLMDHGYAEPVRRERGDPPGRVYTLTTAGAVWAMKTKKPK